MVITTVRHIIERYGHKLVPNMFFQCTFLQKCLASFLPETLKCTEQNTVAASLAVSFDSYLDRGVEGKQAK